MAVFDGFELVFGLGVFFEGLGLREGVVVGGECVQLVEV